MTLEERAYQKGLGLWSQPWARAFYDFSEASGNRVTFNTLTNKQKIVQNTALMSQMGLMEHAQAMGFYSNAERIEAAQIGGTYRISPDRVTPVMFDRKTISSMDHMSEMKRDLAFYTRTQGTGYQLDKHSHRSGYGELDQNLVLDSLGTTNSIWNKPRPQVFESYRVNRARKQAAMQRQINQQFGQSHVNHHRM
jgi:hypothetical protein